MTDIAALGIKISTADVKAAVTELDKLADTGKSVEDANKRIGSSFANAAKKIASDTGSIVSELKALNASQASSASINAKLADALTAVSAALAGTVSSSRAATAAISAEGLAASTTTASVTALGQAQKNLSASAGGLDGYSSTLASIAGSAKSAAAASDSLASSAKNSAKELAAQKNAISGSNKSLTDLSKVTTSLGASSFTNFNVLTTSLGATAFQAKAATTELVNYDKASKSAASSTDGLARASSGLRGVLQAIGVGVSIREFVSLSDASTNLESKLRLVTNSSQQLASVQSQLFAIAQSSRVGFVDLGNTYAQVARATQDLGISQKDLLAVTQTISQAVTISGGSAASTNAALIQLSQGFASGALRGEELNSVLEQTPRLAQAIAQGLGVSIGKLRELGSEGKLTAEAVLGALQKAAPQVADEFAKMTPTIEQSLTRVNNSLIVFIGNVNKLTGAANGVASFFSTLSKGLDSVSSDVGKLASQGGLRDAAADVIRLSNASKELQNRVANGGAFGVDFNKKLKETNAELEIAKKKFNDLNNSAKAPSGLTAGDFPSRGQSIAANDARLAKSSAELTNIRRELSGVDRDYLPTLEKLQAQRKAGTVTEKEYVKLVSELATQTYRKSDAGKSDAKSLRDGTKATNDAISAAKRLGKGELTFDLGAIKNALDATNNTYANSERLLEAQRAASLLSEKDFYQQKRKLIEDNSVAQQKALQAEISRLKEESFTGKDAAALKFENDKKIADAQERLNKSKENSAASSKILTIQEESALRQIARAYEDARIAAQSFYDATNRARDSELAGLGQGSKSRDYTSALNQIREKYEQQRQDLQRDNRNGKFAGRESDYQRELELINEFQDKSLASYTDYYARLSATQQSYSLGVSESLQNYVSESRDVYKQTEELATNAFKGIEDALVTFVTTGKLSFKDLANSVVADITRIIVKQQIANALSSAIGGSNGATGFLGQLFGAVTGTPMTGDYNALAALSGQRAIGGSVSAGGAYEVNERGPEMLNVGGKQILLMGNQGGNIEPNPAIGGGNTYVLNYQAAPGESRFTSSQRMAEGARALQRASMRGN